MMLGIFNFYYDERGWYFSVIQKTRKDKAKKDWSFFSVVYLYKYKCPTFHWFTKA